LRLVLDASVVVDLLLNLPPHFATIAQRLHGVHPSSLAVPYLLDVEVAHVLRRYVLTKKISASLAQEALQDLIVLPAIRYDHRPLLQRAFSLRENSTLYDGMYLVLAEALDATLLTRDAALATLPGYAKRVEVVG